MTATALPTPDYISAKEARSILKVTIDTMYRWARAGWGGPIFGGPTRSGQSKLLGFDRELFAKALRGQN